MFKIVMMLALLTFASCQQEKTPSSVPATGIDPLTVSGSASSVPAQDNFEDLKAKKDESCGTKEDAEKKLLEAAQKPAAFQGATDGDCTVK